jgi:hypothetical protein
MVWEIWQAVSYCHICSAALCFKVVVFWMLWRLEKKSSLKREGWPPPPQNKYLAWSGWRRLNRGPFFLCGLLESLGASAIMPRRGLLSGTGVSFCFGSDFGSGSQCSRHGSILRTPHIRTSSTFAHCTSRPLNPESAIDQHVACIRSTCTCSIQTKKRLPGS